jgi:hypothetical protein
MSDDLTKEHRSKRFHSEHSKIKRQVKIAKQYGAQHNDEVIRQPHRLAKHNYVNCGNPTCPMCMNPRKAFGDLTVQEQRFYQDKFYEELSNE